MIAIRRPACFLAITLLLVLLTSYPGTCREASPPTGTIVVQGKVTDTKGNPLSGANVHAYMNGKSLPCEEGPGQKKGSCEYVRTGDNGLFIVEIQRPPDAGEDPRWGIKISKAGFRTGPIIPLTAFSHSSDDQDGTSRSVASLNVTLERYQGAAFWTALLILVGVYILISFDLVHRTLAAFAGGALVLIITHTLGAFYQPFHILTFEKAMRLVDWNVIFLLMGMMIIVGVLKESGVFQWMAYKSFQLAHGKIAVLSAVLCLITAVLSAFLDNVTTMLLLTPVTIEIAHVLRISPFAFLLPEIMASNFGGTATLIGDPPNIMIGSYAGLSFNDFFITLAPVVIVTLAVQIAYTNWFYAKQYEKAKVHNVPGMIHFLRGKYPVHNFRILVMGGGVLFLVMLLFVLHSVFHMEVAVPALFGAALVLLLGRASVLKVIEEEVEWPSLVFFIMLFVIVGAAEESGILHYIADWLMVICQGNLVLAILLIMWTAAILSAVVDNIPFTATMLPVVAYLTKTIPGADSGVLWWALALGACYGGNATVIGASANVITVGIAEKVGHRVSFYGFLKHGAPITFVGLVLASAYLLIFFT